jgi:phosphoglycolate phosphatase-like HAD superfamily hydrolase
MKLRAYQTLVFDCDGVVLDSNAIKTRAFYQAALPYGNAAARALADYHRSNGGISRYEKMQYFLDRIVPEFADGSDGPGLVDLLDSFAEIVSAELMRAPIAKDLGALRRSLDSRWMIASGGDQEELRQVFAQRNLSDWFDGGIFGSPTPKDRILGQGIESGLIVPPALYLGDSTYDYRCASQAGLDFIFVSAWSEVDEWESFIAQNEIRAIEGVSDLLNHC